jgi:tRNA G18 (ribose-2'-O)-methylase SpoU
MTRITNPANATIKAYRALRHRKARAESGLFLAEGIRLVAEALQLGAPIEALIHAPDLLDSPFGQDIVSQGAPAQACARLKSALKVFRKPFGEGKIRQVWRQFVRQRLAAARPL